MGCAELVQTQLHTDNDYSDPDRPGRAAAALGPHGGQIRAERQRIRHGLVVYGPLQYILGGEHTGRLEL